MPVDSVREYDLSGLKQLDLDSVGNNRFIGYIDRVPFRLETVATSETLGLLFHTRYSKAKQPIPEFPPAPAGSLLETLLREKKADLSADESQIWFNLFAAHELLDRGELIDVLKQFAAALAPYIDFDDQPCFACKQTKATLPIYHSEKINLLCDACHERVRQVAQNLNRFDTGTVVFSLLWGLVVALVSGLIWCVGWLACIRIFAGLRVPEVVFLIVFLALGAVLALPIAWIFKKIPRRGRRVPNWITILTCIATALVGESFLCDYYFVRAAGRFPHTSELFSTWRLIVAEFGDFYFICKIITFSVLCGFTLEWTKSKVTLEQIVASNAR
jgi:hypothetical protein